MASDLIYKIVIYRVDNNQMEIFESDDVKAVHTMYDGVVEEWVNSTAEKRPFNLPPPIKHAIVPNLISEVKIETISKEEYHKQSNPYYKQSQEDGFGGAMNRNFNNRGF